MSADATPPPVRIVTHGPWARGVAAELTEALEARGVDSRRRRLGDSPGSWRVTDDPRRAGPDPELVVVPDEVTRTTLEREQPGLVGDIWVWDRDRLPAYLTARYRPDSPAVRVKVGVVGYNLKFFNPIARHLHRLAGVEVKIAEWPKYAVDSPAATSAVLEWADVIVCEWAGPNAVIASHRKRPGQRLVVRLHRFELERDDWREMAIDAVDTVVTVGDPYRRRTIEVTGWPEEKVKVISNLVDTAQFDRPKLPGAGTTLGLLGATPWRKRPDRALDVLDIVRTHDPAWRLEIKGSRPEDDRWIWEDPDHKSLFESLNERIYDLGDVVTWSPAGPDVAGWFRQVGHVLSTSEDESFHLAPAEGMASGTVPAIWPWFGADEIYDPCWITEDVDSAAAAILSRSDDDRAACRTESARFDRGRVLPEWERLLVVAP